MTIRNIILSKMTLNWMIFDVDLCGSGSRSITILTLNHRYTDKIDPSVLVSETYLNLFDMNVTLISRSSLENL